MKYSRKIQKVIMDVDSDSSLFYQTTYSEDERIGKALYEERKAEELRAKKEDLERKAIFKRLAEEDLAVFSWPGIKFHTFRHTKLKFSFQPSQIVEKVSKSVIFYVSLRYADKHWRIKRDSLPVNYKWKIYKLFYNQSSFAVDDENIFEVLWEIYAILATWAHDEENFRLKKIEKFRNNESVELDSDDQELFLTKTERVQLTMKKLKVLRRMMPPKRRD